MARFTLIVIMPTNRRLLDTSRPVDATTLALLQDWGRLHMVRTVGSLVAVAILTADRLRPFGEGAVLIVLSGLPGVGKTTIARELARAIGATHLRIDSIEQAL